MKGATSPDTLLFVHGLWSPRVDSLLLCARLRRAFNFDVRTFRYASVASTMAQVLERLAGFVAELHSTNLHFVGHSLGGLVIYRFLERFPDQPAGRVVFLGSPVVTCRAAYGVAKLPGGTAILGKCVAEEMLVEHERRWNHSRPLGIIAGTRAFGVGHLVARYRDENDGTIAVSETRLPGATEHTTVRASHTGMLFSAQVVKQTATFLRSGHFAPSSDPGSRESSRARSS